MKGKILNNLCKTIREVTDFVPMTAKLKLIDAARVCILQVETLDGSPVFGVESGHELDVAEILKMKVDDSTEYTPTIRDEAWYVLGAEDREYTFAMLENTDKDPKVPEIDPPAMSEFDVKRFADFVKVAKTYTDHIEVRVMDDGTLQAMAQNGGDGLGAVYKVKVGRGVASQPMDSRYPVDYLAKMVPHMTKNTVLRFDSDFPCIITWDDGTYRYTYLLAPRIESR